MATQAVTRTQDKMPSLFDDFFKPWNEWFENGLGRALTVPAVNITENENEYHVSLAAPGMKKEDLKIDIAGNLLTISSVKEETKEENEKKYTRKEYNYSSFSRSFTIPEEVNMEKATATYENGVLRLVLPRKEDTKKQAAKSITVN